MLYIVATPIGNLEDITLRAIRILKEVDLIVCENIKTSSILLKHYNIKKPLISFNSYSKTTKINSIITKLKSGKKIALISDSGTPGISDPGYILIKNVLLHNIQVIPIPGASACITALSASGMSSNHFLYLGFLPIKKGRQAILKKLQNKEQTVIIYESVHRIMNTLQEFINFFGKETKIVIARELTKKFEEFKRGTIIEVYDYFYSNKDKIKGEFVIIF